jgi:hypothetical protein
VIWVGGLVRGVGVSGGTGHRVVVIPAGLPSGGVVVVVMVCLVGSSVA